MSTAARRWSLVLAVAIALAVRIGGSFGSGYPNSYYPDELNNVERSVNFYSPDRSPPVNLDPEWFNKPALGYYVNFIEFGGYFIWGRYVSGEFESSTEFANKFLNYDRGEFYAIGRVTNALYAAITVLLVFFLTRRIWGDRAGVAGAFLLALSPGHIEWSQVIKHDVFAAMLATWSILLAVRYLDDGKRRRLIHAGFLAGLGWAAKYLPGAVLFGVVVAALIRPGRSSRDRISLTALAGAAFAGGAFAGSPYNFLSPVYRETTLASQMEFCRQLLFGVNDVNPLEASLAGQVWKTLEVAAGTSSCTLPVLLLGLLGVIVGFGRARRETFVVTATTAFVVLVLAATNRQNPRPNHIVFITPFLACAAGGGLGALIGWIRRAFDGKRASRVAVTIAVVASFVMPAVGIFHRFEAVNTPHPYAVAQSWVWKNIPTGTTIINDGEKITLIQNDARIDWIFTKIEALRKRAKGNLGRLRKEGGADHDSIAHWEGVLRRLSIYERKYRFLAPAAKAFDGPRYDSLILGKIWQTESELDKKSQSGFNNLWDRMPLAVPVALPPVERYRRVPSRASRVNPVLAPADFMVTSQHSYDNYDKPAKREGFPAWGAFYDDLRAHYDCWQVSGDRALDQWDFRIYDLRTRIDPAVRPPRINILDPADL